MVRILWWKYEKKKLLKSAYKWLSVYCFQIFRSQPTTGLYSSKCCLPLRLLVYKLAIFTGLFLHHNLLFDFLKIPPHHHELLLGGKVSTSCVILTHSRYKSQHGKLKWCIFMPETIWSSGFNGGSSWDRHQTNMLDVTIYSDIILCNILPRLWQSSRTTFPFSFTFLMRRF